MEEKKAIVSVIGKDTVGIIARVTTVLADHNINIHDISQTILQDFFTMMMIVDLSEGQKDLKALSDLLQKAGDELGVQVNIQLEETFKAMHRI